VGYGVVTQKIAFNKNQEYNVSLVPGRALQEVVVSERRTSDRVSDNVQMSQIEIPVAQIKKIPAFLGEKDVLRVLQLMPGVQKGSEGQTGIYVRGGGPDQNLIILDDAVVYNASHLFGFFSVFNGDALKSVELTKGGFPARFGGRLSSVVELNMKEGNKEKLHGEGGGGLISSRLTLEGPLIKNKASFLVSGRRTYLDLLARPLIAAQSDGGTGGYYFYDLNAKVNYDFGRKDKLYLSGYFGKDRFFFRDKTPTSTDEGGLNWGNATGTLRWNHLFSEKLFSNASLIFSNYQFQIFAKNSVNSTTRQSDFELRYTSGVRDWGFKYDFDFFPNPQHAMRFGFSTTLHRFTPSAVVVRDSDINEFRQDVEAINNVESGLYVEDTWKPNRWLKMNAGLRLSHFTAENQVYVRPEPRLSVAATLRPSLSVKGSYAIMNQYIHLLSNTGIGLPTDLWVPSTAKLAPQQSRQVALGVAKDFDKKGLALTVEGYYKTMNNIVNYKEGASFLLIDGPEGADQVRWDDNITSGRGWSYGAEVLLQKKTGRLSGWIGYTLSWTQWQFPELNFGQTFFPRYDRRHDVSVVGIYELSKRITLSGTWVYGTGNALTLPQSQYVALPNATTPRTNFNTNQPGFINSAFGSGRGVNDYGPKNSFRAEPYHRFDLSLQFHKKKRRHERTWELSVYNLYNRRNPFFYNFTTRQTFDANGRPNGNETVLRRISIFPVVPTLSYNFSF
jgi:TonB-dependent Receptor Plug Domain